MLPPPLQLTFCPRCDYDLSGLPSEGICPECGRQYDQAFVVLRGRPAINGNNQYGPAAERFWKIVGYILCVGIGVWLFQHARDPTVTTIAAMVVALMLWHWVARLFSTRPDETLVWISPVGMGQHRSSDPASWIGILQRVVPLAVIAASGGVLYFASPRSRGMSFSWLLMPVFAGVGLLARPRPTVPAEGVRPPLYAWSSFAEVSLDLRGGRQRLLGRHETWFTRHNRTVGIDLRLSTEALSALQDFLRECRSGRPATTGSIA